MNTLLAIKRTGMVFLLAGLLCYCRNSADKKEQTKSASSTAGAEKGKDKDKSNAAAPAGTSKTTKWKADVPNSHIGFSVKGPFGTVHGSLSGMKSDLRFDEKDLDGSFLQASVETKTISTGISLRNKDLQKEKYLDADNHPIISFRSEKIEREGKNYKAIGDLTLKGVTKRVEIPFSFLEKGNGGVFKGNFSIQRADYNIGKAGGSIGNTVNVELEVPVTK
jgi:polyisoprenoid-binding protein YceI